MSRFLLFLAALLIGGAAGAYLYARQATPVGLSSATAAGSQSGPAGPVPTAAPGEVTVTLTEATLSDQLNSRFGGTPIANTPLGQASFSQLAVHLQSGQLTVDGGASVGGVSLPVSITSTVSAAGGRALVHVTAVTLSGITVPDAERQQVETLVQAELDQQAASQHVRVSSVTIGGGQMVMTGGRA